MAPYAQAQPAQQGKAAARASIARRIIVLIVVTSALLSTLATAYYLHQEYRRGVDELNAQFDGIALSHVPALAANVWVLDHEQTREQLEGIRRLPGIVGATVIIDPPWPALEQEQAQGKAVADRGATLRRDFELRYRAAGTAGTAGTDGASSAGGPPIGTLRVTASLDGLKQRLWATGGQIFGLELLRATVLSTVLILGLRRLVTRRLERIADYTAGLSLDKLDQPEHAPPGAAQGGDDIDRLGQAIDGMRRQLREEVDRRIDVEARSRGLEVEKQAAELANATKSEFLASMSHEIRTPMNAVIGMANLALQGPLPQRERGYVERVLSSAQLLLGILNDILDYSKVEAGMLQIEHAEFELQGVLDEVANLVGLRVEEKGLELVFDLPDELPRPLLGDALRLRQVLLNLCSNAVKFTQQGAVTLRVTTRERGPREIVLGFEVIDSGIGMSAAETDALFRPFTQADRSIARRFGGTGLGLAISQRLMQLMGSRIRVQSVPGQGSCFAFDLRLGVPAHSGAASRGAGGRLQGRLLVVDDAEAARLVLRAMGTRLGFRVDAVADGEAALQAVSAAEAAGQPYRIVLMDWRMPGMDGAECARRIAAGTTQPPCVLMVSALGRDEMLRRLQAQALPVAAVLTKPVTPSSLIDACQGALGLQPARSSSSPSSSSSSSPTSDRTARYRQRLEGLRVLLAEDNEVNVELAVDLLQRVGLRVLVARDGEQALAALRAHPVDGVLMDCQMPVVDGLSAARRIREEPAWRSLPVIAMTANAMVGDREQALAAGMNDHVPKPIDVEALYAALARWLPQAPGGGSGETPGAAEPGGLPPLPGIDAEAGLQRAAGQQALYRRLLRLFERQLQRFVPELRAAIEAGDYAAASGLVHALKGAASTVGAHEIDLAAQALEQALATDASGAARRAAVQTLDDEIDRVRPGLQALTGLPSALHAAG